MLPRPLLFPAMSGRRHPLSSLCSAAAAPSGLLLVMQIMLIPWQQALALTTPNNGSLPTASSSHNKGTPPPWADAAVRAADLLKTAQTVLFVTGAGISAESGLPTYRGVSGLYRDGGAAEQELGMPIEECLSGHTYSVRPELTWKYLLQIERACRGAQPSVAHRLVAAAEKYVPGRCTVMTQNVDDLHGRAGSTDVVCLHGELYRLVCSACGKTVTVDSYERFDGKDATRLPPKCSTCGGPVRPAVVLFDEYLGDDTVAAYEERLGQPMAEMMFTWSDRADRPAVGPPPAYDVSIAIGTSALFAYVNAAALSGSKCVEINPDRTDISDLVDVRVPAGATEALQFIFDRLGWEKDC